VGSLQRLQPGCVKPCSGPTPSTQHKHLMWYQERSARIPTTSPCPTQPQREQAQDRSLEACAGAHVEGALHRTGEAPFIAKCRGGQEYRTRPPGARRSCYSIWYKLAAWAGWAPPRKCCTPQLLLLAEQSACWGPDSDPELRGQHFPAAAPPAGPGKKGPDARGLGGCSAERWAAYKSASYLSIPKAHTVSTHHLQRNLNGTRGSNRGICTALQPSQAVATAVDRRPWGAAAALPCPGGDST
jgi:hypothetical protein